MWTKPIAKQSPLFSVCFDFFVLSLMHCYLYSPFSSYDTFLPKFQIDLSEFTVFHFFGSVLQASKQAKKKKSIWKISVSLKNLQSSFCSSSSGLFVQTELRMSLEHTSREQGSLALKSLHSWFIQTSLPYRSSSLKQWQSLTQLSSPRTWSLVFLIWILGRTLPKMFLNYK